MIFHFCRENVSHTTDQFPMAFYSVASGHPRYQMMHHWHPETELLAVRQGTLSLSLDGTAVTVQEGQFVLIPPGTVHSGIPKDCHYECVVFDRRAILGITKGPCYEGIKRILSAPAVLPCSAELDQCMDALRNPGFGFEAQALSGLYGLVARWLTDPPEPVSGLPRRKPRLIPFEQAVLYLQEHFREPITLREMAAAAGLSEKYFGEYFKNVTGETPVQYLNDYRIEQAAESLKEEDKSITDVALESGFNDLSYFIRAFKKYKGITPGRYEKLYRQSEQNGTHEILSGILPQDSSYK